jgi:cyclic-di-GMP phosphodiesterase, flagellum assembly factor TipF
VRYYEAMARLRTESGEVLNAADFIMQAESEGLISKLDYFVAFRCVAIVRRLLLKSREIGVFCNLSPATLNDASAFPKLLDFMDANRAIASALIFEFSHNAVRVMGRAEYEALAELAARGYRFSMDNLTDLQVEPGEFANRGFRFVKVHASRLLHRPGALTGETESAGLSDLLGRFGIDLIADRIETESNVIDLLDHDVRYGQGFLFSPPRPVRAEALQLPERSEQMQDCATPA